MIVIYKTDTMRSFNSGIQEEIDKFLESSDPSTLKQQGSCDPSGPGAQQRPERQSGE